MNTHCICYITDRRYLLPTFLSAIQARNHASPDLADVLVFLSEPDEQATEVFTRIGNQVGVRLLEAGEGILDKLDALSRENRSHFQHKISVSTFGRLFLHMLLPKQYTEFLYLDGDTQVTHSLDPLVRTPVPQGKFLAARDYCAIMLETHRPWIGNFNAHTQRLGLSDDRRAAYFNPGVIRASTESWRVLGERAYEFFVSAPERCYPHHDQGALNGACGDAHLLISSRWNFPRQLMHLDLGVRPSPAIVHYMAHPKPWHGVFPPWGQKEHRVYVDLIERYPELSAYLPKLSLLHNAAYKLKTTKNYLIDVWRSRSDRIDLDAILREQHLY